MKVIVQSMNMTQEPDYLWDPSANKGLGSEILRPVQITASIIMVGKPEEARELMHRRDLEIRPADRFEKEDKKHETFDIKKGDQIKYQFIRGAQGMGPELSQWMNVIKVEGEMITAVFEQEKYRNKYEFRVLRCQVVAHTPIAKRKINVLAQERIDVPNLADPSPLRDMVTVAYVNQELDPNADLRKKVLEFNLV